MIEKRAHVPCGTCRLCCVNDMIIIHPEHGDDPAQYETLPVKHPLTGKPALMLKHKPNGECVYLGDRGCTIHDRAPAICREYDCRLAYINLRDRYTRQDRRAMIARGLISKEKVEVGRRLLLKTGRPS